MAPSAYRPQLARLVKAAPEGDEWLHEMKYDGYRIGCRVHGSTVRLISRNGKDWTAAFPEVAEAAKVLGVRQALLDGEVTIVLPDGRTSFQALQNASTGGGGRDLVFFVFDLLILDARSLVGLPLEARKRALLDLVGKPRGRSRIRYSDHVVGRGPQMFTEACRLGLEGIISKRRDAPYKSGRADPGSRPSASCGRSSSSAASPIRKARDKASARSCLGDPWEDYWTSKQRLSRAATAAVRAL